MEEKTNVATPEERMYSQAEVEQIVAQAQIRFNEMRNQAIKLSELVESKRLDYLFKVMEYSLNFDDDFVEFCEKEIQSSLRPSETPTDSDATKE